MYYATRGSRSAAPRAGNVTFVNSRLSQGPPSILGSRHLFFCTFYLGLLQQMLPKWKEAGTFPQTTPSHYDTGPTQEKCSKCLSQGHYAMARSGFEPGTFRSQARRLNHSTIAPTYCIDNNCIDTMNTKVVFIHQYQYINLTSSKITMK